MTPSGTIPLYVLPPDPTLSLTPPTLNFFQAGVYPPEKRFDPRIDFGVDDKPH
jgi:hypothetical protein